MNQQELQAQLTQVEKSITDLEAMRGILSAAQLQANISALTTEKSGTSGAIIRRSLYSSRFRAVEQQPRVQGLHRLVRVVSLWAAA
ncbi:MAG: hypothetical protein M5U34_46875 [Chloroflexi bacterium]|nr:hypothetical protein [Chloroflexota bacterium]